jgi:hypothetical protein
MAKKNALLDRDFTGEEEYYKKVERPADEVEKKSELAPLAKYHIQYQVGGLDPYIDEINDLEFRLLPVPTNTEILDDLIKARPSLTNKRMHITILRSQAIR